MKHFFFFLFFGMVPGICCQLAGQSLKGNDIKAHTIKIEKKKPAPATLGYRIVLTGDPKEAITDPELSALYNFLKSQKGVEVDYIPIDGMVKQLKSSDKTDLAWYHRVDSSGFPKTIRDPKFALAIKEYLDHGGKLVLTMDAVQLLPLLGLETRPPEVRQKACIDEGNGRKLGFHSYRDHPLFAGLNGGAYVYMPAADMTVRLNGYFDSIVPRGKVVAIDWDYIFFRENSKLILEYNTGPGKVLAIGEYLYFSRPNRNHLQFEKFCSNVLNYMKQDSSGSEGNYWYYGPFNIAGCPEKQQLDQYFQPIPDSKPWSVIQGAEGFGPFSATRNPWDLAGERMLIMGTQQSGIDEVWTHPFMALRDYEAGVKTDGTDTMQWLKDLVPQIIITPSSISREYILPVGVLTETIAADPKNPAGVIHYGFKGGKDIRLEVRFASNLRFMWPYAEQSIGGLCYSWDPDYQAFRIGDRSGDFAVMAGSNRQASDHQINSSSETYSVLVTVGYELRGNDQMDFIITGTSEGVAAAVKAYDAAVRNPMEIIEKSRDHETDLMKRSLIITSPDEDFNRGYRWALAGTDKFMVKTPGMGTSLVAGYSTTKHGWDGGQKISGRPGYAWYFGRDGQWSGFSLLDYGDFSKVWSILKFYEKYQDLNGKIFHEATTSGVIHYDAADATPLYIVLAGRYFRHSNDTAYLVTSWPAITRALYFCQSTDTDGDMLIENTNVGHGWVEGGELYGSHSTLYLNACWLAALDEAANMAAAMRDPTAETYLLQANEIRSILSKDFWMQSPQLGGPGMSFGYFSYGKNKDKSFRKEITVLPSVYLYFGMPDGKKATSMLGYWSGNNFSTNWGVRIIGEDSPLFKPTGYHYGSVWPLFTGWTALAEYKYGQGAQGYTHIMNNLNVYRNWDLGYVEEVLNGAKYQPSGVCPHQCWSETMVLQPAIEGLLGFETYAQENKVVLAPNPPVNWDSLEAENLRIGNKTFSFSFHREPGKVIYNFRPDFSGELNIDFMPVFPAGTRITGAKSGGESSQITTFSSDQGTTLFMKIILNSEKTIEVSFEGGAGMIPLVYDPNPGSDAAGPRIISTSVKGDVFTVITEGLQGTSNEFRYWNNGIIHKFIVDFPASTERFTIQTTTIDLSK
jgi:glycogen debranching enzyme